MLRLMLDHHPQICWFGEFDYAVDRVGDDGTPPNVQAYHDWLKAHRIFQDARFEMDHSLDYPALVKSFVQQAGERSGKPIVGATIHRHFRRILHIWPNARLIHIVRDPRDVARSFVKMGWAGSPWIGVRGWVEAEREWDRTRRLLDDKRMIEIRYEDLVSEPRRELERICNVLDVEFNESMLQYDKDSTYDAPDASMLGQWNSKLSTRDVRLVETRVGDLLERRGYTRSEAPPLAPGVVGRGWLYLHSKIARAQFGVRKYGIGLWMRAKIAHKLGLHAARQRARLAMNEIDRTHLK